MAQRSAAREIAWSLAAAVVFGTAFAVYLLHEVETEAPYRDGHALAAFTKTCKGSRFLAGARQASIFSTRRNAAVGGAAATYTFTGQGLLIGAEGNFDASFTFMTDGHDLRILVLSIAGIPVLDGITGQ